MADVRKQVGTRTAPAGSLTKPGVKYPTPDVGNDYLIIESKNVDSKEQPIAYGTVHPNDALATLIDQSFSNESDGQKLRTRVYAAYGSGDQQDLHNYTISYLQNSVAHRVIARSYIVPRATYTPVAKKTADTIFGTALLTDEYTQQIDGDKTNWRVTRIFEELPGPELIGRQMLDQAYGQIGETITQTVWNTDAEPTTDYKTLFYQRTPLDSLKSTQTIIRLPEGSSFPVLTSAELDPTYDVSVQISKQIVARVADPDATLISNIISPPGIVATITEYAELDKYRSIRIVSTLKEKPADRTWYEIGQHSFPDELLSFNVASIVSYGYSASKTSGGSLRETVSASIDPRPSLDIREGYSGPVRMRVTEKLVWGPPTEAEVPEPVIWNPQSHQIVLASEGISGGTLFSLLLNSMNLTIPSTLHGELLNDDPAVSMTPNPIAATEPAELPHGEWVVKHTEVRPWRFGLWSISIYEMFVP